MVGQNTAGWLAGALASNSQLRRDNQELRRLVDEARLLAPTRAAPEEPAVQRPLSSGHLKLARKALTSAARNRAVFTKLPPLPEPGPETARKQAWAGPSGEQAVDREFLAGALARVAVAATGSKAISCVRSQQGKVQVAHDEETLIALAEKLAASRIQKKPQAEGEALSAELLTSFSQWLATMHIEEEQRRFRTLCANSEVEDMVEEQERHTLELGRDLQPWERLSEIHQVEASETGTEILFVRSPSPEAQSEGPEGTAIPDPSSVYLNIRVVPPATPQPLHSLITPAKPTNEDLPGPEAEDCALCSAFSTLELPSRSQRIVPGAAIAHSDCATTEVGSELPGSRRPSHFAQLVAQEESNQNLDNGTMAFNAIMESLEVFTSEEPVVDDLRDNGSRSSSKVSGWMYPILELVEQRADWSPPDPAPFCGGRGSRHFCGSLLRRGGYLLGGGQDFARSK